MNLDQIVERVARGENIRAVTASLLPPAEQELLRRCALVRYFDQELVDGTLRGGIEGGDRNAVPFERLMQSVFVEPAPGLKDAWRVRPEDRDALGSASASKPPDAAMMALTRGIIEYYRTRGDRVEELYHLLLVDPERARMLFTTLYDEADARFDLARCQDLIAVLDEQLGRLPFDLVQVRHERQVYLNARAMWTADYFRSERHLHRAALVDALEALLAPNGPWILQLYAMGGVGKTAFLRWAVARYAVPVPRKIPCARIDFDVVDPVASGNEPWLVFLDIARQLNRQMPGAPLGALISEADEALAVFNAQTLGRGQAATASPDHRTAIVENIPDRLASGLAESRRTEPVLLIFDTLEELLLRSPAGVLRLVDHVARLRESYPALRLILSGRYNLEERVDGYRSRFRRQSRTVMVPRFESAEARRYLVGHRGLAPEDARLEAVVERAEGVPFKLSIFADILQANPRVTAEEIRTYPADLLYLIERVVDRIRDEQVKWLLRYGVVPRRLTLGFVETVMRQFLPPAMSGESDQDRPGEDLPPELRKRDKPLFRTDLLRSSADTIDLKGLWDTLAQYAGGYSWLSQAPDDPKTLLFHGDVVNPMRRMLQRQRVFRQLHEAAIRFYDELAQTDSDRWLAWTREAVYHRFQLHGESAIPAWREAMERAEASGESRRVRDLATEILGAEYVDDGRPRRRDDGMAMISFEALLDAHVARGRASVELARATLHDPSGALWAEAATAFAAATRLRQDGTQPAGPAPIAILEAVLLAHEGKAEQALKVLAGARAAPGRGHDNRGIDEETGDILLALGRRAAIDRYRDAVQSISPSDDPRRSTQLREKFARALSAFDRDEAAIAVCRDALRLGGERSDVVRMTRLAAGIALKAGQPATALDIVSEQQAAQTGTSLPRALVAVQARAMTDLGDPLSALALFDATSITDSQAPGDEADLVESRAYVLRSVMDFRTALQDLDQAGSLWRSAGSLEGAARCVLRAAEIQLHDVGAVTDAGLLLAKLEHPPLPAESLLAIEARMLRADIHARSGALAEARRVVEELLDTAGEPHEGRDAPWTPATLVRLGVTALVHGGDRERALSRIADALEFAEAPLSLLAPLGRCPSPATGTSDDDSLLGWVMTRLVARRHRYRRRLAELATSDVSRQRSDTFGARERALDKIRAADVSRVLGDFEQAAALVRAGALDLVPGALEESADAPISPPPGWPYLLRLVLNAMDRLGWELEQPPLRPSALDPFLATFGSFPTLCAAALVEHANRVLAREVDATDTARGYLDTAAERLSRSPERVTRWSARLAETHARLAERRGDVEARKEHLRRAASVYEQLGDTPAATKFQQETGPVAEAAAMADIAAPALLIRIERMDDERLHLQSGPPDRRMGVELRVRRVTILRDMLDPVPARTVDVLGRRVTLPDWIGDRGQEGLRGIAWAVGAALGRSAGEVTFEVLRHSGEVFSYRLLQRLRRDWIGVGADLGALFPRLPDGQTDVRFEIAISMLSVVPWEFLRSRSRQSQLLVREPRVRYLYRASSEAHTLRERIRWIQGALNRVLGARLVTSGMLDPRTETAIRNYRSRAGLPEGQRLGAATVAALERELRAVDPGRLGTSVVVLRPTRERELRELRGSSVVGVDVAEVYRAAGYRVHVKENPTAPATHAFLREVQPTVIHVCAGFREAAVGGVQIEFGRERTGGAARDLSAREILSPSTLHQSVQSLTSARPVVILDPPRPPGLTEALRQLLLRNAYASELFTLGNIPVVIAAGLVPGEDYGALTRTLVDALSAYETAGVVCQALRRAGGPRPTDSGLDLDLERSLGSAAVALFAHDPEVRPLLGPLEYRG